MSDGKLKGGIARGVDLRNKLNWIVAMTSKSLKGKGFKMSILTPGLRKQVTLQSAVFSKGSNKRSVDKQNFCSKVRSALHYILKKTAKPNTKACSMPPLVRTTSTTSTSSLSSFNSSQSMAPSDKFITIGQESGKRFKSENDTKRRVGALDERLKHLDIPNISADNIETEQLIEDFDNKLKAFRQMSKIQKLNDIDKLDEFLIDEFDS